MKVFKFVFVFIAMCSILLSCESAPNYVKERKKREEKEAKELAQKKKELDQREKELAQIANNNPNDTKAQYDLAYFLYYDKEDYVQTIKVLEKLQNIDPNYRVSDEFNIYTGGWGFWLDTDYTKTDYTKISSFSINLFIALAHWYSTSNNRENPSYVVKGYEGEQIAINKTIEMAKKGYDIDIVGGKNTDKNLRIVYLYLIACNLDDLYKRDEANVYYKELSNYVYVVDKIAKRIGIFRFGNLLESSNTTELLTFANEYRDKKDFDSAVSLYRRIIQLDPNHKEAKNNFKLIFDKKIAESHYPSPFEGTWVGSINNMIIDTYTHKELDKRITETKTMKFTDVETFKFNGKNYTILSNDKITETGTFYYDYEKKWIELESGKVIAPGQFNGEQFDCLSFYTYTTYEMNDRKRSKQERVSTRYYRAK